MNADTMWALWYALPDYQRVVLIRRYGSEFDAAWALYGGL